MYVWVVTAVCFYIWTLLAYDRVPWKMLLGSQKSHGTFCNRGSGNPVFCYSFMILEMKEYFLD